jgi:hypothetical protein
MKKLATSVIFIFLVVFNAYCDTVPGRFERQKIEYRTDPSEIKPDERLLFETAGYNQALVVIGFLGVIAVIGGFAYLLAKRRH